MVWLTFRGIYDKFQVVKLKNTISSKPLARYARVRIFYMSRKTIRVILVMAISLAIPVSSAYVGYYTVASADFLSSNLGFEAFDQEYLLAANQSELKVSSLVGLFSGFQPGAYFFGPPSSISSQISSLDHKILVLRC